MLGCTGHAAGYACVVVITAAAALVGYICFAHMTALIPHREKTHRLASIASADPQGPLLM